MTSKNFKAVLFHLSFLTVLTYLYMRGVTYSGDKISGIIEQYFGISGYIILFVLIMNFLTVFIEERKKRNYITLLSHMSYPVFMAIFSILIAYELNLFEDIAAENLQYKFLQTTIFKYKLGLIPTYILSKTIMSGNVKLFWGSLSLSLIFLFIIALVSIDFFIVKKINKIRECRKRKRELEKQERQILENIAIKEDQEKKKLEQANKIAEERERSIKKRVEDMNPLIFEYLAGNSSEDEKKSSEEGQDSDKNEEMKLFNEEDFKSQEAAKEEKDEELQILSIDTFLEYEKKIEESRGENNDFSI